MSILLTRPTSSQVPTATSRSYDAFISYKQATESRLAAALRTELHGFAKPWHTLRAVRVFLDRSSMDASPKLWASIEAALRDSRYFIYLASPEAAASPWVQQELTEFLRSNPTERLIIVLAAGEIAWNRASRDFDWEKTTAFPRLEPGLFTPDTSAFSDALYHDARWARGRPKLSSSDSEFRDLVATLSSTLRGIPKDALAGEDVRQRRKALRLARWGGATLAVLAAGLAIAAFFAIRQTRMATLRLARTYVESGSRLWESGDPAGALPWFFAAWKLENRSRERSEMHRLRFASALTQAPLPRQVWWVNGQIWRAAFSPDGARVLVTGGDMPEFEGDNVQEPKGIGVVEVHVVGAGARAPVLLKHRGAVSAAMFSLDGRRIFTASFDSTAALWDAGTGQELRPRWRHRDRVNHAELSPDGRRVLTVSDSVRVRDAGFREAPASAPVRFQAVGAAFSPDGNRVAVYGWDTIALWDLTTGRVRVLATDLDAVSQVVFTLGGSRAVVVAGSEVFILDVRTGIRTSLELGFDDPASQILLSADGVRLVTFGGLGGRARASHSGEARVWSVESAAPLTPVKRASYGFTTGALSPDGCWVALASDNGMVSLSLSVADFENKHCETLSRAVMHHGGEVRSVIFGPDGRTVLTASADGGVRVWDVSRRDLRLAGERDRGLHSLDNGPAPGNNVIFSADGHWAVRRITSVGGGDTLRVFPRADSTRVWEVTVPGYAKGFALSGDGQFLAVGGTDSLTRLWDVRGRASVGSPKPHDSEIWYIAFSRDGRRLAVGGSEGTGRIWDTESGDSIGRGLHHLWTIFQAAFDESGRWIVTGSDDGSARVWEVETGAPRTPPLRHGVAGNAAPGVRFVSFMPDGRRVVSVDDEGEVRTWDAETGELTSRLDPIGRLWDVSFRNGGGLIARRSETEAFVWDVIAAPPQISEAQRWAEMLGHGRVDATGALVPLEREEVRAVVRQLLR